MLAAGRRAIVIVASVNSFLPDVEVWGDPIECRVYFRELAALPRGPLDPRAVAEIMSRYATEVVPPAG